LSSRPKRELLGRTAGVLFACGMLAGKALQFQSFPGPYGALRAYYLQEGYGQAASVALWLLRAAVWTLETAIAAGYLAAFATRLPAKGVARGFMETAFPLLVLLLPAAITGSPYTLPSLVPAASAWHAPALMLALLLLAGGEALNVWGLMTLRRSFSMMPEARALVTSGPFKRMRHPLYAGHSFAFLGYALLHWSPAALVGYGLFVAGQIIRARMEEAKLQESFPEYAAYKKKVPAFFPGFTLLANAAFLAAIAAGLPFCSGAAAFLGEELLDRGLAWALAGLLPLYCAVTLAVCLASRRLEELDDAEGAARWDSDPWRRKFHDLFLIGSFGLSAIFARSLPFPMGSADAVAVGLEAAAVIILCAELASRTIKSSRPWTVWLRLAAVWLLFAPFRKQAGVWDLLSAGLAAALSGACLSWRSKAP
jgi:protein-S-isoprenylcysteine O-methyltransferase Ste14